jgi:hypothetical protein
MAVRFKAYAKFRVSNHAACFYPGLLHYTTDKLLHTFVIPVTEIPDRIFNTGVLASSAS